MANLRIIMLVMMIRTRVGILSLTIITLSKVTMKTTIKNISIKKLELSNIVNDASTSDTNNYHVYRIHDT